MQKNTEPALNEDFQNYYAQTIKKNPQYTSNQPNNNNEIRQKTPSMSQKYSYMIDQNTIPKNTSNIQKQKTNGVIDPYPKDLNFMRKQTLLNQGDQQEQNLLNSQKKNSKRIQALNQNDLTQQELDNDFPRQQLQFRIHSIQNLWQYRYIRYLQNGIFKRDWMKLFSFLGQFKQKCINILRKLVNSNLTAYKEMQDIDYRSNMKNDGQEGIYLIDGIIVRLAQIKYTQNHEIDDAAVKGLHQQFLAYNVLNNLFVSTYKNQEFQRVKVPLTALVKYLGFTALCQADTTCQGLQTLIHGPTATIYQYRQQSMPILQKIGQQLNLKDFKMKSKDGKVLRIPFSLTVQLHKVSKQLKNQSVLGWLNPKSILYPPYGSLAYNKPQYYLLNVRKLFPLFIDSDIMKSSGYLRPQIVLSWKNKLSNTVFSQVAYKQDPSSQLQLADACKTLKQQNVKILAKMLDNTTIFLIDSEGIQQIMHQYGVNIRFIGDLAKKVSLQFSRKVLQTQMIARTCKKYFFPTFHQSFEANSNKDIITYLKQTFVDYLNLIFIRDSQGQKFYRNFIYQKIKTYYEYQIKDYPPNIPGGGMLHALAYHFGIKVKVIDYPFFQIGVDSIFNTSHITQIVGYSKTFDMDTTEIKLICRKFKDNKKKGRIQECISQLKLLAAINRNLNHQKTHNLGSYKQSYFYAQLAQIYFHLKQYEMAKYYAQLSLKGIPQKHADAIKPFGVLVKYHSVKKQINRCIQYYQKSLGYLGYHLSPDHPLTISVYNTLGYQFVTSMDPAKCQKIFMKSFQICQQALGYMHHTSSQILMQLANLPLPPEKTITFLLQSLTILQNLGQHQDLIKQVSMRISQQYDKLGNIPKMIFFAKKSGHWMMEIRGQDRLHNQKLVFQLCNRVPSSVQQVIFLTHYAAKSYLRGLQRTIKDTLYKIFVTYRQSLQTQYIAACSLMRKMTSDRSNINNVSQFVKTSFVQTFRQISRKLSKYHFYTTPLDEWDKSVKNLLDTFIEIMSTVTQQLIETMFLTYKKTF